MKTRTILILPLLMIATCLCAQTSSQGQRANGRRTTFTKGRWTNYDRSQYMSVRLGLNVPQLYYNGMDAGQSSIAMFSFGLYSGWQLGSSVPIFFETGLEYNGKGANSYPTVDNAGAESVTVETRQHYLTLPFVFKYKIHTGIHGFTVQPLFGGFLAAGVGGDAKYYFPKGLDEADFPYLDFEHGRPRAKASTFRSGGMRAFDAGLRLGCGLAYTNFYFEARYDIGLYNIATDNFEKDNLNKHYGYDSFDDNIHTGCFSLIVGVEF